MYLICVNWDCLKSLETFWTGSSTAQGEHQKMDVKSFSRNHKHQIWIERILACKASGLPVKTWCKQNGIAYSSYYHWLRETRQDLLDMHEVAAGNPESSSIVESPLSLTPITFHELPVVSEVVPEQEGAISL